MVQHKSGVNKFSSKRPDSNDFRHLSLLLNSNIETQKQSQTDYM